MSKVEHLETRSTNLTPEMALEYARNMDFEDVIILGFDKDGDFIVRVSAMTNERGVYLCSLGIDHAKGHLE